MTVRPIWFLAVLPLCLLAAGCGGSRLVKVSGRLTHKGQPVPSTQVTFAPDDGSRMSKGLTDDNGNFTMRYSRTEAGVARGKCTVYLEYVVGNEEYLHEAPPKASPELKKVIEKYKDPKTSGLHYEITRNGQFVEIDLE